MDRVFFEQLRLPDARYNLDVGSGTHGEQTGKMLAGVEKVLQKEEPDVVLVLGDTNSVLSGALAATKLGIKVGHVEAGLRSYDQRMPEETNRVLTDHCSDILFAPTEKSKQNLLREGIPPEKIVVTGNTIVDAVQQNLELSKSSSDVLDHLSLKPGGYLLATIHRQENVDDEGRFQDIMVGLELASRKSGLRVIYPVHPHSRRRMIDFGIRPERVDLLEPMDYLSFLQLQRSARLVLTDSGGVQEETCILNVPCVTLRDNTERPETLDVGSNVLAGTSPDSVAEKVDMMIQRKVGWTNPFGDGKAAARIVERVSRELGQ
jgi:UDP-N-acetylglucosamine 2-epimerase (non-hydrolysing)